jgi:hypothetical protein
MTERDIILNELAQGLRPMPQGIEWFDTHGPEEQAEVLLFRRHHCMQARAVTEDGPESRQTSPTTSAIPKSWNRLSIARTTWTAGRRAGGSPSRNSTGRQSRRRSSS